MYVNRNNYIASRLLAGLTICIAIASPVATAQARKADDLGARLAKLERRLDDERRKLHIPGLAIAVVKNDKVVLAKGFGYRDLETKQPVTPETLFAVGSTTKAFTATLIGMLADESAMGWDDPVNKHIPDFRLNVDTGAEEVTVRDLLCHRTGFTRMGVLWAAGGLTRSEVFERVTTAKPLGKFRKQFLYNNVMYMTAGHAAGKAVDSDWASLVVARILRPLKMNGSSTSITDAKKDPRLAKGYRWSAHERKHVHLPMRNLDLVGPAGSINSNVRDMARWVRFQLGKGELEGKRLLSETALAETWKPQIKMGAGVHYGLGWMLREWNGSKVIEHGGSIDGFAAQVSLLPEHDLGYVLLANVTATPLQQKSIHIVFDSLVGNASEATAQTEDLSGLLGKYVANFSSWRDGRFTVLKKGNALALDVPRQQVYELKAPDAEGKRYFAMTDQVAVSFQRNDDGKATSLTMHQGGFAFECPREGVQVAAEIPLEELQPLLGTYRDERRRRNMSIIILNNRLAIEEQGGGLFELVRTGGPGKWALRANQKRVQFHFNKAGDGSIRSLTRLQRGKQVEMPRVAKGAGESLPTVESLIKRIREGYGADKVGQLGHVRMTGELTFVHQGARGKVTQVTSGIDRMASSVDLGKTGHIRTAYDGRRGWQDTSFGPSSELFGKQLQQLAYKHPLWLLQDWREKFDSAAVVGSTEVAGEKVYLLKLSAKSIPSRTVAVSAETGLVLREKTVEVSPVMGQFGVTLSYGDYRRVHGVMLPFKVASRTQPMGEIVTQFDSAKRLDELSDDAFRLTTRSAQGQPDR